MSTKFLFGITLFAYAMIVSQAFMYILSLKQVQMNLGAATYTEVRQLTDSSMRNSFKYVIYVALAANLLLLIFTARQPGSLSFITALIALLALVAEILLTLKGNLPVNDMINSWKDGQIPANWEIYREKWFRIFQYRQIASISGFASLLIGAIFGSK